MGVIALRKREKQKHVIGPALLLFVVFIFSGLYLADVQMNDLTQKSDFSRILNIKRDQITKEVMVYFIGEDRALGKWEHFRYDVDEAEITVGVAENRIWRIPYKKWYIGVLHDLKEAKAAAESYCAEFF